MAVSKVFATVGTTSFDKFVSTISNTDNLKVLNERGCQKLTLQIGRGKVLPPAGVQQGIDVSYYRFKEDIGEDILESDLVISHAGAGSCLESLEAGKKLLVVVNDELMHNHQYELAERLQEEDHLIYTTCDRLGETLLNMDLTKLKPFPKPNGNIFSEFIDHVMGFK